MAAGGELIGRQFLDVTFTGIAWRDEGVDLHVELPDGRTLRSTPARFECRRVYALQVALDLSKNPGPPLSWEGEVRSNGEDGFRLLLDFGSSGGVIVECGALELRLPDA